MAKRKWNWGGRGEQDWRPKSKKVVLYSREFENKAGELQPDGKRVLALDTVKFASLLRLLDEHRGGEAEKCSRRGSRWSRSANRCRGDSRA